MLKKWIVEKLGGYYPPTNKHDILTALVSKHFSTISTDELLTYDNGLWYIEGRPLTENEVRMIKSEAQVIQKMFIWDCLLKEVKYQAYKKGYLEAKNEMDLIGGKMMIYNLDIIKTKLKNLSS